MGNISIYLSTALKNIHQLNIFAEVAEFCGKTAKDIVFDDIIDYIFSKLTNLKNGGSIIGLWTTFCDAFEQIEEGDLTSSQVIQTFILNIGFVVVGMIVPDKVISIAVMSALANFLMGIEFDYENGRFW